jgi:hypothetical protein
VYINPTQAQINNYLTLAPETNDNLVSPETPFRLVVAHRQRMFGFDHSNMYWSDIGDPEAMNTVDNVIPVGITDGEPITGVVSYNDSLVIFKRNKTYYLDGDDPETWVVRLLNPTIGCVGPAAYGVLEGVLYFYTLYGPYRWAGSSNNFEDIATKLIGTTVDPANIVLNDTGQICMIDHAEMSAMFAVKTLGSTTHNLILPFSTRLDRWTSNGWNGLDISAYCQIVTNNGESVAAYADTTGHIYVTQPECPDGLPFDAWTSCRGVLQAVSGEGTGPEAGNYTLLTIQQQTGPIDPEEPTGPTGPPVTSDLTGRYIWVWQTALADAQHLRITASSGPVMTVDPPARGISPTGPTATHYALGGIMTDIATGFRSGGAPFSRKRIEFVYLELTDTSGENEIGVRVYKDLDALTPVLDTEISIDAEYAWDDDVSLWDSAIFDHNEMMNKRIPIRQVGRKWQTRLLALTTGSLLKLHRIGVQWLSKTKKAAR